MTNKTSNKPLVIRDVYDFQDLLEVLPFNAENIYHIRVDRYGYLHDVGIEVVLTPINGERPTGWESLESDFNKEVETVAEIWRINAEYGYH